MLKIFRSPKADFARDAELADQVYTEDALKALADAGFNAVWVRVIYRQLLKHPRYPSFGEHSEEWLASLSRVVERGARCGVRLVLYCQEPFGLSVDDPFWSEHPEMGGATRGNSRAMCVSTEPVRQFLVASSERMLRRIPGVAAVIAITASEFTSHCYSHYWTHRPVLGPAAIDRPPLDCPRCRERPPTEVVLDILHCMRQGISAVDSSVPLIAWNWSWYMYEPDPQPSIISRLGPGIEVQADFERGDVKVDPTGREIEIDEYSLSFVGPSEQFMGMRTAALQHGRRVYAKLQLSATHELASVSNVPLIESIYGKAKGVRDLELAGFMGCWNFGNELTLNTDAFNFFLSPDCPSDRGQALTALAQRAFPGCDVPAILQAWRRFSEAFDYYPFSIPFLYWSPINYALALPMRPCPIHEKRTGPSHLLVPRDDNDDPSPSFGPFAPEEIADRCDTMVSLWEEGLGAYVRGLSGAAGAAEQELSAARAVDVSLRSIRNYFRLYLLKRDWRDDLLPQFREIVQDEIGVLEEAIPVYENDPRQGFHIEGHGYMVTPELMRQKRDALLAYLGTGLKDPVERS